jgi:hypothetical protein
MIGDLGFVIGCNEPKMRKYSGWLEEIEKCNPVSKAIVPDVFVDGWFFVWKLFTQLLKKCSSVGIT